MANDNPYQLLARERKARSMISYFDRRFSELGRNPYKEAKALADMLRGTSPDDWRSHAVCAGVNPPSRDTVDLIIAEYDKRSAGDTSNVVPIRKFGGVQ